jgi:hypothetical protein
LNAILDIRTGDVEAKGIAGKECNILQKVAPWIVPKREKAVVSKVHRIIETRLTIEQSCDPVDYSTP